MPKLARWYIKTALAYLGAALLAGVLLAVNRLHGIAPALAFFTPAYIHLFVVGWLTQLIFGVAFWMFPRFSKERPHGREGIAWATYAFLNAGLLLRAAAEPAAEVSDAAGWRAALIASALLQWIAGLVFVGYIWPRVRAK